MKPLIYRIQVVFVSLALILYAVASAYPIKLGTLFADSGGEPVQLDLGIPLLLGIIVALVYLRAKPCRYKVDFKAVDNTGKVLEEKAMRVLQLNNLPLLCGYGILCSILSALTEGVGFGSIVSLLIALWLFVLCHKYGFQIIQSWYEDKNRKVLKVEQY
ncbi:MAG: hypothetical protein M0R32_11995 [Candidatus Cloacimonetes bacterium]|jgi:hypothetical protein|nr:hypothetical protein [Candidatus Cloacimonadota bacterium]